MYDFAGIERKWQSRWKESMVFEPRLDSTREKRYILSMFPYPSGNIHMGHVRNYCIGDVMARYYRMHGFNVLHPIGYDAFGMPAENAAIKNRIHPKTWTYDNIERMTEELYSLGFSFSRERMVTTCDPEYTRYEQEFVIKLWKKGLLYRKKTRLNWCPNDLTVLANEQVIDGRCWRCSTEVVQREMHQYYLRITSYAQELLDDLDSLEGKWPSQVINMQKNWIGRSHGLRLTLSLSEDSRHKLNDRVSTLDIYTTRPDTIFGCTFCAVAPEHEIVSVLLESDTHFGAKRHFIDKVRNLGARERSKLDKEGVFLNLYALHPLTGERLPIWVGNFVLMDYGTGAIMCVPGHDERDFIFAKRYSLPLRKVILGDDLPVLGDGTLVDSGEFSGLDSGLARERIIRLFEEMRIGSRVVNFRLRDWGISRQRYWGAPIPFIHCSTCGIVEEVNLPVLLPDDVEITGEGNPLDNHPTWRHVCCPRCGQKAVRETDTMDTFIQSSWYFLRYTTPADLRSSLPFESENLSYFMDVDEYIGGIEHAILHLLYARFFTKVLRDLGYIRSSEPFSNLLTQGMVLKDGAKMSKSRGNVVAPGDIVRSYGADSARLFVLFASPPTLDLVWSDEALKGCSKFIHRLIDRRHRVIKCNGIPKVQHRLLGKPEKQARFKVYDALLKQKNIFEKKHGGYPFNVLIAACMDAHNAISSQSNDFVFSEGYFVLLNILEGFIPHIASELSEELFGLSNFVAIEIDHRALIADEVTYVISVNGKKRGELTTSCDAKREHVIESSKKQVARWLVSDVMKVVFVHNKIVNFVL